MDIEGAFERFRTTQEEGATAVALERAARIDAPLVGAVDMYRSGLRWAFGVGVALAFASGALHAWQQWQISTLSTALRAKEYLVVPGASDFVAIRPNMVPDQAIIAFAEYVTGQLVTVSARTIEDRHDALAHLMAPALEERLRQETARTAAVLAEVQGAEVFDQTGRPTIERKTVDGRSLFEAVVTGRIERYAFGQALEPTDEAVTLWFRTRQALGPAEPWVFELLEIERRSTDEQRAHERAEQVAGGGAP